MKKRRTTRRRRSYRIGAARRSGGMGDVMTVIQTGAGIGAGVAGARMLVNNIGFLRDNRLFGSIAQIGAAVVVNNFGGKMAGNVAAGMAAEAVISTVVDLMPGVASSVGLSGLGRVFKGSAQIPGVAGMGAIGQKNYANPVIRVQ